MPLGCVSDSWKTGVSSNLFEIVRDNCYWPCNSLLPMEQLCRFWYHSPKFLLCIFCF